jgi:hypothetical protein
MALVGARRRGCHRHRGVAIYDRKQRRRGNSVRDSKEIQRRVEKRPPPTDLGWGP